MIVYLSYSTCRRFTSLWRISVNFFVLKVCKGLSSLDFLGIEGTGSKLVSRLSFTMFDTHAQRCDVVLQPVLFELRDAAT